MRDTLAALIAALDAARPCVLCHVVETRGSTPQKAGAAMIVFDDGSQVGTLGGGCVEAEVKRRALQTLADPPGSPALFTFHLDDNYGWDDGLICGGRMTILADPLGGPRDDYFRKFHRLVGQGRGCTETVSTTAAGDRWLFDSAGQLVARLGERPDFAPAAFADRPHPYHDKDLAFLPMLPRITLLIVGAGHVGHAVARLAHDVDFNVWVVDDRETFVSVERFPTADRRVAGDIGQSLARIVPQLDASVYALIVTRGHAHDEEALYHLATTPCGYVGLIGSKRKIKMIFEDLLAKNIPAAALRRVHAPLGFDIGSQTVNEIAISIVAELIAVRNLGQTIAAARTTIPVPDLASGGR